MNNRLFSIFLIVFSVMQLNACAAPPVPTVTPTVLPSPTATIAHTPTPIPTPTATPMPTIAPVPLIVKNWQDVALSTLCLQITQNYENVDDETFQQPIRQALADLLSFLGVSVLPEGQADCPAVLNVDVIGKALSGDYTKIGICYTGANINAKFLLSAADIPQFSQSVNKKLAVAEAVLSSSEKCRDAKFAPFFEVWPAVLLEGAYTMWGVPVLVAGVKNEQTRSAAMEMIKTMDVKGNADTLIPAYAALLLMDDRSVAQDAAHALTAFGELAEPALPVLVEVLEQRNDWILETWVMRVLGNIGRAASSAVPALIAEMEHPETEMRYSAVDALRRIEPQSQRVLQALIAMASDANGQVRDFVLEVLAECTGQQFATAQEWQAWWVAQAAPAP